MSFSCSNLNAIKPPQGALAAAFETLMAAATVPEGNGAVAVALSVARATAAAESAASRERWAEYLLLPVFRALPSTPMSDVDDVVAERSLQCIVAIVSFGAFTEPLACLARPDVFLPCALRALTAMT